MNNFASMQVTAFEREKDLKATLYTVVVCGAVAFLFFFIQWNSPQIPQPIADTGIEVNLGNSETGFGNVAPQVPGDPSNANETNVSVPPPSATTVQSNQNINADETGDEEVNSAAKSVKAEIKPKAVLTPTTVNRKASTQNTAAAENKRPKALMSNRYTGGNGNGGNGADTYNNIHDQGIAGGHGDQGKPNGNPNSNNYTGNGGTGTGGMPIIRSGLDGRRIKSWPSFKDNFNEPAKVAVDVTVDASGKVISANVNPVGTTTPNRGIWNIATSKAKLLKFNAGSGDEQHGTIVFNFKVQQ